VVVIEPDPDGNPGRVRVTAANRNRSVGTMSVLAYRATCRPVTDGTFLDLVGER